MMKINISTSGQFSIAALDGQLDVETSPAVREQLLAHVEQETAPLLLDMSKLTYCSSMGLRVLFEVAKAQRAKGVGFGVYGLSDYLAELFEIAGVGPFLGIYDNQKAAMDGVGA
jgi:anti-sigma B factor antagonist